MQQWDLSHTGNVLKFRTLFSFCSHNKMLVIMAGIHKMLVKIANMEDPDQNSSSDSCSADFDSLRLNVKDIFQT